MISAYKQIIEAIAEMDRLEALRKKIEEIKNGEIDESSNREDQEGSSKSS